MHTRRTCVWVTLLGGMLVAVGAAQAQDDRREQKRSREIVIGEALTIRSEVLDEDRVIFVGKPADYDQGKESYPVLFLLDGNDHFHHATAIARSLASNGLMPRLLIVAIDNTVRIRDLTPRGVGVFASLLEDQAPPGLTWHIEPLLLESHGSVPLRGLYRGLEFVVAGWTLRNPLDTYNRFGIEGIEHFFAKSDKTYGYARGVPQPVGATLARELLESGRLDEVADLLARYRERMRPPAAVVERLAAAYRERGRIDRAIDLYRQALQINPKSEVSRRALTELGQDFSDLVR